MTLAEYAAKYAGVSASALRHRLLNKKKLPGVKNILRPSIRLMLVEVDETSNEIKKVAEVAK